MTIAAGWTRRQANVMRETGLHAALAMALVVLVGAILDNVPVGFAAGLLVAALVTARWPIHAPATPPRTDDHGDSS